MVRLALGAVALALSFSSVLFAQAGSGAPRRSGDVLAQLLAEVHGLRLAMERGATIPPRIQLLTSRLSMQESRVSRLAIFLDNTREQLARLDDDLRRPAEDARRFEEAVAQESDPRMRREWEAQLKQAKLQAEMLANQQQRLRARESELLASYTTEQALWQEISNRLDELERSLVRP